VPVIDRLAAEHVVTHEVLEDVDELLEAVDVLTDTLLSHLSYEERERSPSRSPATASIPGRV